MGFAITNKAIDTVNAVKSLFPGSDADTAADSIQDMVYRNKDHGWDKAAGPAARNSLWYEEDIAAEAWNRQFPYQLMLVLDIDGKYEPEPNSVPFTLPIPPKDMTVTMPFAITTNVTLTGVVEEHAGTPLRLINFEGTTGTAPYRKNTETVGGENIAEKVLGSTEKILGGSVLGGTVDAIKSAVQSFRESAGLYKDNLHEGSGEFGVNSGLSKNDDEIRYDTTGYYQFHLLRRFLEGYANSKRYREHRNLRLALCVWKDSAVYLVTPVSFNLKRSSVTPYEYQYNLSFKAWARIQLQKTVAGEYPITPIMNDQSLLGAILQDIDTANAVIRGGANILGAFRGDVQAVLNIGREVAATLRAASGLAATVADFPESIQDMVAWEWYRTRTEITSAIDSFGKKRSGLTTGQVDSPPVDPDTMAKIRHQCPISVDEPLSTAGLPLTSVTAAAKELNRIKSLTSADFLDRKATLTRIAIDFASAIGASDASVTESFGGNVPVERSPTEAEIQILWAIQDITSALDRLICGEDRSVTSPTVLEYVAGIANKHGIPFTVPASRFAVPLPYGVTLDRLAARYLGDPNRWHEIATLNGLMSPYIDEVGFTVPILANGAGSRIILPSRDNLFPGQVIQILSKRYGKEKRKITGISSYGDVFVVTLDGPQNLERYTAPETVIHAFLPNTVNSQNVIYIPSPENPTVSVDEAASNLEVAGVDLLLTETGDLALAETGEVAYSVGLNNIVQVAKLLLSTPRGTLLHHPEYGIGIAPGTNTADVDASEWVRTARAALLADGLFQSVTGLSMVKTGKTVRLDLAVQVRESEQFLPLSFSID